MPGWKYLVAAVLLCAPVAGAIAGLNPAASGLPPVDNAYGYNGVPNNNVSSMCVSCHTAVPILGKGTHFVRSVPGRTTNGLSGRGRTTAWTGSGAFSRYGNFTTSPPTSDNTTSSATELICESCHNMTRNVAGGSNIVESYLITDARPSQPNTLTSTSTTLCEGCHVSGTLPAHHAMTGDALSDGSTLSTADTTFVRGFVDNVSDVGPTGMSVPPGSEVRYPGANKLPCLSCHGSGHNGYAGTGARLLRRGYAGPGTPNPQVPPVGVSGADTTGIDRQFDFDPTGTNRLIGNFTPLCDACHRADD